MSAYTPGEELHMHDVFISHSSQDKPMVERLARALQQEGLKPWFDKWDLAPGDRWREALEQAILDAPALLVCYGPSGTGPWQAEEVRVAIEQAVKDLSRRVIPVWLPDYPANLETPLFLRGFQAMDLRGLWDEGVIEELVRAILDGSPLSPDPISTIPCPYRGLDVFEEEHARWMFGRDREVTDLLGHLRGGSRLLVLIGASGSGKSSLVRAGLVPSVRTGELNGSFHWRVATLRPGTRPLDALATELLMVGGNDNPALIEQYVEAFRGSEKGLANVTELLFEKLPDDPRLLIVVDQFEEVFTEAREDKTATNSDVHQLVANLLDATAIPNGRIHAVLTVRADFLPRCLAWSDLAARLQGAVRFALAPLGAQQVKDAVRRPALAVGFDVEPAVVGKLVEEVAGKTGSLPLLQHLLRELWEERDETVRTLTWTGYEKLGGVHKGITHSAARMLEALGPEEQRAVRKIVGRLVHLGEGTEDTRRRAAREELGEDPTTQTALDALVEARLVSVDEGHAEMTHEALIREWDVLRGWIDVDRALLQLRQEIHRAAKAWDAGGREVADLWRGGRLTRAAEEFGEKTNDWRQPDRLTLISLEAGFLAASLAVRHEAEQEEIRRKQGEMDLLRELAHTEHRRAEEMKRRREQETKAAALEQQAVEAEKQRAQAEKERAEAEAKRAAEQARAAEKEQQAMEAEKKRAEAEREQAEAETKQATDREEAERKLVETARKRFRLMAVFAVIAVLLMVIAAWKAWQANQQERIAEQLLVNNYWTSGMSAEKGNDPITAAHFYARATRGYSDETDIQAGRLKLQAIQTVHNAMALDTVMGHDGDVLGAAFSADESRILTWSADKTARLWRAGDGVTNEVTELARMAHDSDVLGAMFSTDESRILTWSADKMARLWQVGDGAANEVTELARMAHDGDVLGATFSADESRILTWSRDRMARLWRSDGVKLARMVHDDWVRGAVFSADESRILTWSDDNTAWLWRSDGAGFARMSHDGDILGAAFSADESRILIWSRDRTARLWRSDGVELARMVHDDWVRGAVFSADESRILTWSDDNTARLWGRNGAELARMGHDEDVLGAAFSGDESRILTWSLDRTARLWRSDGAELVRMGHDRDVLGAAFSGDESRILTWSGDGTARLWGRDEVANEVTELARMGHDGDVLGAAFSADDARILTWSRDRTARLWRGDGAEFARMAHDGTVNGAAFSADEFRILSWSADKTTRLWEHDRAANEVTELARMAHDSNINGAAFSGDESRILTWSGDGTARLWGRDGAANEVTELARMAHDSNINGAAFSTDESRILTWGSDGTARLWWAGDGVANEVTELARMGHDGDVFGAVFSTDESRILTWSLDGTARLWQAGDGAANDVTELARMGHDDDVFGAVFSADESRILTWSFDGTARLWQTGDEAADEVTELARMAHDGYVLGAVFSADESRILTWSRDRTTRLWRRDGAARKVTEFARMAHDDWVRGAVFSADESRILTWSDDNTARLWRSDGKELARMDHDGDVLGAVFSADESRILTWSRDRTARLWRNDGVELARMTHDDWVRGAAFSADESRILTWSGSNDSNNSDNTVRLWAFGVDDFPQTHLPLRVEVITGTVIDDLGNVSALTAEEWKEKKAEYERIAREHGKPADASRGSP